MAEHVQVLLPPGVMTKLVAESPGTAEHQRAAVWVTIRENTLPAGMGPLEQRACSPGGGGGDSPVLGVAPVVAVKAFADHRVPADTAWCGSALLEALVSTEAAPTPRPPAARQGRTMELHCTPRRSLAQEVQLTVRADHQYGHLLVSDRTGEGDLAELRTVVSAQLRRALRGVVLREGSKTLVRLLGTTVELRVDTIMLEPSAESTMIKLGEADLTTTVVVKRSANVEPPIGVSLDVAQSLWGHQLAALSAARAAGQVTLISGLAGSGKRTLLATFAHMHGLATVELSGAGLLQDLLSSTPAGSGVLGSSLHKASLMRPALVVVRDCSVFSSDESSEPPGPTVRSRAESSLLAVGGLSHAVMLVATAPLGAGRSPMLRRVLGWQKEIELGVPLIGTAPLIAEGVLRTAMLPPEQGLADRIGQVRLA